MRARVLAGLLVAVLVLTDGASVALEAATTERGSSASSPADGDGTAVAPAAADERSPFAATFTRYSGAERYATAVVVSRRTFPLGADRVFVATGTTFPDALAAGAVAGRDHAPILLTAPDALPATTALELERLEPTEVIVLGGPAAVSEAVLQQIAKATAVTPVRVGGAGRYETAALLSSREFDSAVSTAFVATGENFPDALAAGPLAAARRGPVLLTAGRSLPDATARELERLEPREVIVLGGDAAIDGTTVAAIERAAGVEARRVSGDDRYATAIALSQELGTATEIAFLATGGNFPDALGGGPAAALRGAPLLLTPADCLPQAVHDELERRDVDKVAVLGGPAAVSDRAAAGIPCGLAGDLPELTFAADAAVTSVEGTAPPRSGTTGERRLAAVRDASGAQLDFARNELVVVAAGAELQGILERTGGRVVETTSTTPPVHRVLVDPPAMDGVELARLLRQGDLRSRGAHRASSPQALGLLTLAAREAVAGHLVTVNYRTFGADYLNRQLQDGSGAPGGYDANPFTWPWLRNVTDPESRLPDWGVAEAWRALELAGRFIPPESRGGDRIGIAIMDGGFPDRLWDYDLDGQVASLHFARGANTGSCFDGASCPWHGTHVAQTAAANGDNGEGTAGVGHPVTEVVPFQWNGDVLDTLRNWVQAHEEGVSIVNQSFSVRVPASLYVLLLPVEAFVITGHLAGISFVAAAGNGDATGGLDVDATDCFFACWEEALFAPCELEATICVGGSRNDYYGRHSQSNYNTDSPPGATVDVYAPWDVYVAGDPDNDVTTVVPKSGSSFSAPYVSGLLALIRAADRSVAAIGSEDHLLTTVVKSGNRWFIDAERAVLRALGGDSPPSTLRLDNPSEGAVVRRGQNLPLELTVVGGPPASVTWYIDDLEVSTRSSTAFHVTRDSLSLGDHEVRAEYRAGRYRRTFRRTVTVENTPPTVTITNPGQGYELCRSCSVTLRATSHDPDEPSRSLQGTQYVWKHGSTTIETGEPVTIRGDQLGANGTKTLTLVGTDSSSATATDTVTIVVVESTGAPSAHITSPANGTTKDVEGSDGTGQYATFSFKGYGDDGKDGLLTGSALTWTTTADEDGDGIATTRKLGTGSPLNDVKLYTNCSTGPSVDHTITLTAEDADGNTSPPDQIVVTVNAFC